jgi:hypothetical protein
VRAGKHLSLLSAELHGHNEEKEVLNELVRQQRHTITVPIRTELWFQIAADRQKCADFQLALQRTKEFRMSIDRKHKEAVATQEKTKKCGRRPLALPHSRRTLCVVGTSAAGSGFVTRSSRCTLPLSCTNRRAVPIRRLQLKKEIAQLEHERDLFMLETEQARAPRPRHPRTPPGQTLAATISYRVGTRRKLPCKRRA